MKIRLFALAVASLFVFGAVQKAQTIDNTQHWVKIRAKDKFERSVIANYGVAIEYVGDDYVIAFANPMELSRLESKGIVEASYPLSNLTPFDFPTADADFHNYSEMKQALQAIHQSNPNITQLLSIGKTYEGRDILALRISGQFKKSANFPGVIFMGGHHAREHLSVEVPIRFAKYLVDEFNKGNQRIVDLINNRDIHIVPAVNPDGLEYDVSTGQYKLWRKNRHKNSDGTYGVDLNRNYAYGWGTGGSSKDTTSDVYMGEAPFSEPETQAIKNYVESNTNITVLLTFHTFSKLILYPWGGKDAPIADANDRAVHETMARKMAKWNGYTPMKASDLYIASGDTTDWAFGTHKIISFTFEMDPGQFSGVNGFYPGARVIDGVVKKNIEPCLYLIDHADNPYRALAEPI